MSERPDYGEPWRVQDVPEFCCCTIRDADGNAIAIDVPGKHANYIVACVNALAGVERPELVIELLKSLYSWGQI